MLSKQILFVNVGEVFSGITLDVVEETMLGGGLDMEIMSGGAGCSSDIQVLKCQQTITLIYILLDAFYFDSTVILKKKFLY